MNHIDWEGYYRCGIRTHNSLKARNNRYVVTVMETGCADVTVFVVLVKRIFPILVRKQRNFALFIINGQQQKNLCWAK